MVTNLSLIEETQFDEIPITHLANGSIFMYEEELYIVVNSIYEDDKILVFNL